MRHLFPILGFLTLGLASCTGCTKKDTTPVCTGANCALPSAPDAAPAPTDAGVTPVPPATSGSQTLSGVGWSLVVPEGYDTVVDESEEKQPEVLIANEEEHSVILLIKEPFARSTSEYALAALRGITEAGGVLIANKQADLNNNKYVLLDSSKDGIRVWAWLTVKNGFGYSLSCGGPANEDHHEALCTEVADSLNLH